MRWDARRRDWRPVPYFILSPVEAARDDLSRIESVRRIHDPHHGLVEPHATLVFGFERPLLDHIVGHVRDLAARFAPIACRFDSVRAVRDVAGSGGHLFLIPTRGAAEIVALHEALYEGPLRSELRAEIPFIPHVTIGRLDDHVEAEALAERLSSGLDMAARLTRLDLVAFDGGPVAPVASWPLAADPRI